MTTQAEMLASQWKEDESLFGFTDSDWFKDLKEVAGLWGFVKNGGLSTAGQQQSDLMYAIERPSQPNAQYIDPRQVANGAAQTGGIPSAYLIGAIGLAALVFLAVK